MRIVVGNAVGACSDACFEPGIHGCTEMAFEARLDGEAHTRMAARADTQKGAVIGLIKYMGSWSLLDRPASVAIARAIDEFQRGDFFHIINPDLKLILAAHDVTIEPAV